SFGIQSAARAWEAGAAAIDVIESITVREQIACDFRRVPGFLTASLDADRDERQALEAEAEAAQRLGFPARFDPETPLAGRPGVRFPNQAKFHPLKYLTGLAKAVDGDGCAIFNGAEVGEVKEDPLRVVAGKHEITADYIVIATHNPLMGKAGATSAALF